MFYGKLLKWCLHNHNASRVNSNVCNVHCIHDCYDMNITVLQIDIHILLSQDCPLIDNEIKKEATPNLVTLCLIGQPSFVCVK